MPNLPGFHARAPSPGIELQVSFWAAIINTGNIYQISSENWKKIRSGTMKTPLKTRNLPGFHAQAWPGMQLQVIFWAEKLILVIIFQFLPKEPIFL
jgi:hypothetical protein